MDELIHQFLLQSGYPRASIVTNVRSMIGRRAVEDPLPTFIIVDPESSVSLGIITVVDAIDGQALSRLASMMGRMAEQLDVAPVQGYVIRVDVYGASEAEQVQFYRVWPDSELQQLSARTFPDMDSLRVSQKIALRSSLPSMLPRGRSRRPPDAPLSLSLAAYGPGLLLAGVALADWAACTVLGHRVIQLHEALMLTGAAFLLMVPPILRQCRELALFAGDERMR